jgi:hypothetical protein
VGVHYEFYGAPFEKSGLAAVPVGGPAAVKCGYACGPITVQLVGKYSPHPDLNTYNGRVDKNNWAPNFGLSWNLPWWGKTVLRTGYGISYTGALRNYIGVGGVLREGGMFLGSQGSGVAVTPGAYTTLLRTRLSRSGTSAPKAQSFGAAST